jgi:hypothetical protein
MAVKVQPNPNAQPTPASPICPLCRTKELPDGSLRVEFDIDPDTLKRYMTRANTKHISYYLWENVIYRSIISHVY